MIRPLMSGRGDPAPRRPRGARGARGASRGAAQTAAQPKPFSATNPANYKKTERGKDAINLKKPWMTEALRAEIYKKHAMQDKCVNSQATAALEAFKEQRSKVNGMVKAARLEWVGAQDEQDATKIYGDAAVQCRLAFADAGLAIPVHGGKSLVRAASLAKTEVKTEAQNGSG